MLWRCLMSLNMFLTMSRLRLLSSHSQFCRFVSGKFLIGNLLCFVNYDFINGLHNYLLYDILKTMFKQVRLQNELYL